MPGIESFEIGKNPFAGWILAAIGCTGSSLAAGAGAVESTDVVYGDLDVGVSLRT